MKSLIDAFWLRYSDLQHAVVNGETVLIDLHDREIDPLLRAIHDKHATSVADARLQFRFLLDLLRREADDSSNVMRHSKALLDLAERYLVEAGTGAFIVRGAAPIPRRAGTPDDGCLNEAILESLPDRVCVITADYRYLYANALYAEKVDEQPMKLVGRHMIEFVGLQSFEEVLKPHFDRCFAGETVDYTYAVETVGRTVVIRCRMTPCRSGQGQVIGAIFVMQEIADRRRVIAA